MNDPGNSENLSSHLSMWQRVYFIKKKNFFDKNENRDLGKKICVSSRKLIFQLTIKLLKLIF